MIKCFLNFEHAVVGVFPVIIKSSVNSVSVFFERVLNMKIENTKVRQKDFNSFGFLKINVINQT